MFTQFSGQPQCFLTERQLIAELEAVGFIRDPDAPLTEYNRPRQAVVQSTVPVIYEGVFRRQVPR